MAMARANFLKTTATGVFLATTCWPVLAQELPTDPDAIVLDAIVLTAEEQVKQALGVSNVTARDLEKQPVSNDISEVVRKMPGVNLTGNSPSGQRGNQRQIDIRGMGPENTLILIDGKPVLSRNSVKMGRSGERDTRGDSNWVPAELIERIEVLRGPAAARYGSGAAGGVVNIITKQPEEDVFSFGLHADVPHSDLEGRTYRTNFMWARPINDRLSFRLSGNYNKSDSDDTRINEAALKDMTCTDRRGNATECTSYPAGVEGVVNKDLSARLSWAPSDADRFDVDLAFSRQGNIYGGDILLGSGITVGDDDNLIEDLANKGAETNVMYRKTASVSHKGTYGWGDLNSYLQYEGTRNTRLQEGLYGGGEGTINTDSSWDTARMNIWSGKTEAILDRKLFGKSSAITLGAELRRERLDLSDYTTSEMTFDFGDRSSDPNKNDPVTKQMNVGLYAEANILWNDRLTLTPSIRADWADTFGTNLSGGINATYDISPEWKINGGIARAFKSPNLYQMSEQYAYYTRGYGCPFYTDPATGELLQYSRCHVIGNKNLDPETSWNKEIGVAYSGANGVNATLTYFHNDYHDKIQSGLNRVGTIMYKGEQRSIFQWENIPNAVVSGLEGSLAFPMGDRTSVAINATYMTKSEQELRLDGGKTLSVPLSLVPDYTINASLEYEVTDRFIVIPSMTHYGRINASDFDATNGRAVENAEDRGGYTMFNLAASYEFRNGTRLNGGITNVFDKQVLRQSEGANTFNEPGRAFYLSLNRSF